MGVSGKLAPAAVSAPKGVLRFSGPTQASSLEDKEEVMSNMRPGLLVGHGLGFRV